jgi:hypothetical protein
MKSSIWSDNLKPLSADKIDFSLGDDSDTIVFGSDKYKMNFAELIVCIFIVPIRVSVALSMGAVDKILAEVQALAEFDVDS